MTSRLRTGLLPLASAFETRSLAARAFTLAWGAIQWPWLARSLWGGRRRDKHALLDHLDLPHDALPHLGSWKADTALLWHIVGAIERLRPATVVELGCGASSLIIARALERNGGGRLLSFDQHAGFVEDTAAWLAGHGLAAEIRHAPIVADHSDWGSLWYGLPVVPESIDLLVIDGPPWTLGPFGRGRAEILFEKLRPGAIVLLDDAARPGERVVAARWRRRWPDIAFTFLPGAKGTLAGVKDG